MCLGCGRRGGLGPTLGLFGRRRSRIWMMGCRRLGCLSGIWFGRRRCWMERGLVPEGGLVYWES